MKKFISLLFMLAIVVTAFSQNATASAEVTIRLHSVQSITVNPIQKSTILDYRTIDDYGDGVFKVQEDHLQIFSTGAFLVTASSTNDQITRGNGAETIEASTIQVTALEGSNNPLTGVTLGSLSMTTTPETLINSGVGSAHKNFNIKYSGIDNDGYVGRYFDNEQPTDYKATIMYTISPQ